MGLFNTWRPTMVELPDISGRYLVTEQTPGERVVNIRYYDAKAKRWKDPEKIWHLSDPDEGWITNVIVAWKKLPKTF